MMKIAARPRERELRRSYDLIAGRLAEVESELMRLCDSPVATISKIGDYLRSGGGKRIRPAPGPVGEVNRLNDIDPASAVPTSRT